MVISNPINLNRMSRFLGTKRHVNDLGQDKGDNGKELNMAVPDITIRGEVVTNKLETQEMFQSYKF